MLSTTPNGISYEEDIVSSEGASFILFPEKNQTQDEVKKAKEWIRSNRDVVSIRVAKEDDWDEIYKSEIFRHKLTKPLKWYEIKSDSETIRKERIKGTSIDEYVNNIVLPNIEQTKKELFLKYGDAIFTY